MGQARSTRTNTQKDQSTRGKPVLGLRHQLSVNTSKLLPFCCAAAAAPSGIGTTIKMRRNESPVAKECRTSHALHRGAFLGEGGAFSSENPWVGREMGLV